jgi:hypothetical protein
MVLDHLVIQSMDTTGATVLAGGQLVIPCVAGSVPDP